MYWQITGMKQNHRLRICIFTKPQTADIVPGYGAEKIQGSFKDI